MVDVADDFVEIFPCEVATPDFAGVAAALVVVVVLPEPSGTLCCLHHVIAHQVGGKCHRHVAEALMSVGGDEVKTVVHCRIYSVHRDLQAFRVRKNPFLVHICGGGGLHQRGTRTKHRGGQYDNDWKSFHEA